MEAQINMKKNEVKIKKKQRDIDNCEDSLDQEELQIELIELLNNNRSIENSMKGAIRKMSFLMTHSIVLFLITLVKTLSQKKITKEKRNAIMS